MMDVPIIVAHDRGCRYAREDNGGHSDVARRLADIYNLHRTLSGRRGGVIAVRFSDGATDGVVYPDRETAMSHQHHNERWYCYAELTADHMSLCAAASLLRFQAHAAKLAPAERGQRPGKSLIVIPRLGVEHQERQIGAMAGRINLPVALGRRK